MITFSFRWQALSHDEADNYCSLILYILLGYVHGPLSPAHQASDRMWTVRMCLPGTAGSSPVAQYLPGEELPGEEPCKRARAKSVYF